MLNKVVVLLLIVACSFGTYSIMEELTLIHKTHKPANYFSIEDATIYAINFPCTINPVNESTQTIPLNSELINSLAPSIPENCSVYFSKRRGLVVFESNYDWTQSALKSLFANGKHKVKFTGNRELSYGEFNGHFTKNILVLRALKVSNKTSLLSFNIDKKASRSIIEISEDGSKVTDYYEKTDGQISYSSNIKKSNLATNADDQSTFSQFIPSNFDAYTFFELNYLAATDSVFDACVLSKWIETGLLILKNNEKRIFIMDMKEGQRALDNLNEVLGIEDTDENFSYLKNFKLTQTDNETSSEGYYIADIQNFVILSKDKMLFDALGAEISLGNSLNKNQKKSNRVFSGLPKNVLHRSYEVNNSSSTISKAGEKWITTNYVREQDKLETEEDQSKSYFSMNPSEKINSFYAYSGRGNTFLITASNKWIRFENGIRMWEKTFDKKVVAKPKLMEMSTEQNQDISILFEDEALIVDKDGRILNRFPTSGSVHPIRFKLRKKISFLIPNVNTMTVTDNDGQALSTYSFSSRILDMVLFKENGRKYVGVLCEKMLFIIDLEQKRTKRKFPLEDKYSLLNFSEKSVIISSDKNQTIDLKGIRSSVKSPEGFDFKTAYVNSNDLELLFTKDNEIMSMNSAGQFIGKKSINCTSIDHVVVYAKDNRQIQIGVLDGIENKIVLLNSNNFTEQGQKRHGEKNLQLTTYDDRGISITTFLGDKLIQYTKF
jgi:hypothetical protein